MNVPTQYIKMLQAIRICNAKGKVLKKKGVKRTTDEIISAMSTDYGMNPFRNKGGIVKVEDSVMFIGDIADFLAMWCTALWCYGWEIETTVTTPIIAEKEVE